MSITIVMPSLSPTMEEGTLVTWFVREGDRIAAGDVIAEIETDKATLEFGAPASGILARIIVPAGTAAVAVNTPVGILAEHGEDPAVVVAHRQPATAQPAPPPSVTAPKGVSPVRQNRQFASPLARRVATANGVDLSAVSGSGPHGRIIHRDVTAAISAATVNAATTEPTTLTAARSIASESAATPPSVYRDGSYELLPLDSMRRTIARRLTESKQTVPHFYLRAEVQLDAALALRAQLNASAPTGDGAAPLWKISVNDMMIKALGAALRDVPEANVTWADGHMRRHKTVDVAVAVAIDGGLVTPVIRDAEAKSLSTISNEMKSLVVRARERKLAPTDYQGGTTSLSNLGMYGVTSFDAVINPPQGTILAIGAAEKRSVVRGDESVIATMMTVTLSVDHRTVDGALGARLLAAFRQLVEDPLAMLV